MRKILGRHVHWRASLQLPLMLESRSILLLAIISLLSLTACTVQRLRDQSSDELAQGRFEAATATLEQGLRKHPDEPTLKSGLIRARNEALTRLLNEAAVAKASNRLDDAEKALERALAFDTGERRVSGLLDDLRIERRQARALDDASALAADKKMAAALRVIAAALKDNPRHSELRALQRRLEVDARQAQVAASQRGLAETRMISLDFREANLRTVLDLVSRNSGINFVLDKDVRSDVTVSVYLRNARVEDAIDLIAGTHQLAKKVIDGKTILIYPNTPEKQREHQEQVVKVFYLASADAKGAASFLRSMLKLKEPFVDERTNMVAIRESEENVALAERLMALYDSHDPEVLLEVEVIEVRANRLTELGVKLPDSVSLTVLPPGSARNLTLGNLASVGRDAIAVGIGGLLLNLRREVGDFNTLANPSIRVRNREKARVMIGDKVPVITTTIATGGLASDSVNYVEVGLKLEVEPTVFADDDVAIKVGLEASTLAREVRTNSGTLAYQIGTRNANTVLRLRDGETQLLAGLINREDRMSASRLPGVGDLPMLGRFFSNQRDESVRTELVLAITPRVLRNVRHPDVTETEMWVGTDAVQRLRPMRGFVVPEETSPVGDVPSTAPAPPAPPSSMLPVPSPVVIGAMPGRPQPPLAMPAATSLTWSGRSELKAGESGVMTLHAQSPVALRGASFALEAGGALEIVRVEEGDFFRQGGANANFSEAKEPAQGRTTVALLRSDLTGAAGQGDVLKVHVRAKGVGAGRLSVVKYDPHLTTGPAPAKGPLPAIDVTVR